MEKDFHLGAAVRALAGWGAVSGSQQHSLCAAPSSEVNIGKDSGGLSWPRL